MSLSDKVVRRSPPLTQPRVERVTQMLIDSHCLQSMTYIVENASGLDARLDLCSLILEVEATLSQFNEPEVGVLTALESRKQFDGLYEVEAAVLYHLSLIYGRKMRPNATHRAVLPIVRRAIRRPKVPLVLKRPTYRNNSTRGIISRVMEE